MRDLLRGLLIAVATLLVLEFSARVADTFRSSSGGNDALAELGVQFSAELGWERMPDFQGRLPREPGAPQRRFDAQGFPVAQASAEPAAAPGPTIFTIGDSSTFGWGAPAESSYPAVLDRLTPGARVVNLGVLGYTSFQGYKALLKYAPALEPRVVIVSSNYNDRRYVLSPGDEDSDARFQRDQTARRLNAVTSEVYLYRAVRSVMARAGLVPAPVSARASVDDVRDLHARVPPERYRENLTRFAEFSKQTGIPVIFMTLADNPAYTEYLRRGVSRLEAGDHEEAVRMLEVAVALQNPFSDVARKYLAVVLEKQGDIEAARSVARLGRPQFSAAGGTPVYLDAEYNDIMRSVAAAHDIEVVDVARALGDDPTMYVDYCHPNVRGYEAIARLLAERVNQVLGGSTRG